MKPETERKYLVEKMPDLTGIKVENQERYFLELGNSEKRVTRIGDKYIYEEKSKGNGLTADKVSREITKKEFEELQKKALKRLVRKSYVLLGNPEISIKIYCGEHEGLVRAEFEFESEDEARKFAPPEWVKTEITETDIGRDGRLVNLSRDKFLNFIGKYLR